MSLEGKSIIISEMNNRPRFDPIDLLFFEGIHSLDRFFFKKKIVFVIGNFSNIMISILS